MVRWDPFKPPFIRLDSFIAFHGVENVCLVEGLVINSVVEYEIVSWQLSRIRSALIWVNENKFPNKVDKLKEIAEGLDRVLVNCSYENLNRNLAKVEVGDGEL
ncbi:MAG: hypothetical protein QM571_02890 [Micrococcaceae bacterium]